MGAKRRDIKKTLGRKGRGTMKNQSEGGKLLPTKEDLEAKMESGELFPFYSIVKEDEVTLSYRKADPLNRESRLRAQGNREDVEGYYDMSSAESQEGFSLLKFEGGHIVASGRE
jgi:hypothetical protein